MHPTSHWAAPLRQPGFRRYLGGHGFSSFGDSLVPLTIAFAALDVGGPGALGAVLAANRVPIALLVLLGGALGDRWDRRLVMLGADLLRAATQVITGFLLVTGSAGVAHLVVLQALAGVGTALFTPAAAGLVPALVDASALQRAHALLGLTSNTTRIMGISGAGVLVATTGTGAALLVDAATFAASAACLATLHLPAHARRTGRRSLWHEVRDGAQMVARTPWLRILLGYSALLQALVIGPHMVAGPLLAADSYGGSGAWAVIGVVQALGALAGGALALRWQPAAPLPAAVAASFGMVPYLLLLAAGAPLWLVALAAVLVGAQGSFFLAIQATVLQQQVPDHLRSRVHAWAQLGNLVLVPAGLAVTGPVAAALGGHMIVLAGAAWMVTSTVLALTAAPIRHLHHGTKKASPAETAEEASHHSLR